MSVMPERCLTGAIQKADGRLYPESVRFLQIGCGIPFEPPTGRQRFSVVDNPQLKIGTEGNGGLAAGVATGKYHWAIVGLDMVKNLPDDLLGKVDIVRRLGFQPCQYRLGVSALAFRVNTLEELRLREADIKIPETLEELKRGTRIATKHVYYLERCIKEHGLDLRVVYDSTPETAPEFRGIRMVVADIVRTGATFRAHEISPGGILLESQAVLIKARRLPPGTGQAFSELLTRVDRALENPQRWLNPDLSSSQDDSSQNHDGGESRRRFWHLSRLIPRPRRPDVSKLPMVASILLFTLAVPSAILNPWPSRTSGEKDLRS